MKESLCSSCKKKTTNAAGTVSFGCPNCGKTVITRCGSCRTNAVKYACASCEFVGPN